MSGKAVPWHVRPYRPGDEAALVQLFERANGRPMSVEHWLWKLQGLPSPVPNVWLALVGEQPVFQYSALPLRYRLPDGERLVMTSVDIMTDPDWQRQGLLTTVGAETYRRWETAGVPFTLGLPNERWGSRKQALGWETLFPLRWYKRPLQPGVLAGSRGPERPASGRLSRFNRLLNAGLRRDPSVSVEPVRVASEAFDTLWERCAADHAIGLIRDRAWVAWRFLAAPDQEYTLHLATRAGEPAGYIVTRLVEADGVRRGLIPEWLAPRDDPVTHHVLLRQAIETLAAAGAQSATTLAVPGSPGQRLIRRAGFLGRAAFTVRLAPFGSGVDVSGLADRRQWRLFGSDFDVI